MKHRPVCIYDRSTTPQDLGISCNAIIVQTPEDYIKNIKHLRGPLIVQGVAPMYAEAQRQAKKNGIDYYNIDNGYFGNFKKKIWFRVTKNNLQLSGSLIKRKGDRVKLAGVGLKEWDKRGSRILICQPSKWSAEYFGYSIEDWTDRTVEEVRRHTNRGIVIRPKPRARADRIKGPNTLVEQIKDDILCVVTSNSLVATESIINGIPAFVTENNAASAVSLSDLSKINTPAYLDRKKWIRHLSYGQFTREELKNGYAWSILNENSK
tara:strand:+ start:121 stop:915 length:795 start_codon:yes stop_codon:yes gene_type:complete